MDYANNDYLMHYGKKGMKWGVRRYQNKDGTLTDAGKKRYTRDAREKEFDKYDESTGTYYKTSKKNGRSDLAADANRYVKEDLQRSKSLVDDTTNLARNLNTANDMAIKNKPRTRLDLSGMSDQDLRNQINRELLERQYNDVFNQATVSKGREYASNVLKTAGVVLPIASSALAIALDIKHLLRG